MAPVLTEEESALDPYSILAVEAGATEKEIKKAYRQLSLKYHPDKNKTPEAVVRLHEVKIAIGILEDAAKRTYVDTKLEADRRRKEKYAASDKRKQEMIDALLQREEAAKKARVDAGVRRREAAAEEEIKEAGKRMLEEAQKRAAAAAAAAAAASNVPISTTNTHTNGSGAGAGTGPSSNRGPDGSKPPPIAPVDLTLILQFPPSTSTSTTPAGHIADENEGREIKDRLSAIYGPISDIFIKDPSPQTAEGSGSGSGSGSKKKSKKVRGRKVIVEFKEGNWGGCWSCWKDVENGKFRALQFGSNNGVEGDGEGVKVKWAGGDTPQWVDWATSQPHPRRPHPSDRIRPAPSPSQNPKSPTTPNPNPNPNPTPTSTLPGSNFTPGSVPTFASVPDFTSTTMSDLLSSHNRSRDDMAARKKQEMDFESMTLLRMRQMERDRLADEIRRQEGEA